ncbi:MAG: tripartite tricarboxylate transporter permease, partial [Thermodesulfobacteriota bacterium]
SASGHRPLGGNRPAHSRDLRYGCDRGHHYAGRDLLRGHVRRVHHFDPDEHPRGVRVGGHLPRRLPDDQEREGGGGPFHRRLGVLGRRNAECSGGYAAGADAGQPGHEIWARRNVCPSPGGLYPPRVPGHGFVPKEHGHDHPRSAGGDGGMDNLTGAYRFTFAIRDLFDGIGFVPVAMGMFGIGEILSATEDTLVHEFYQPRLRELLPNRQEFRASIGPILRGSGLGFFVGLLPGSAHVLSSFLSYIVEKRLASRPEEFGTGRIEGVAGPETANNAATGGAMVPFLALGIPTGPAIAVMMIALLIHGIRPGPLFISEQPQLFWSLIASMYIGNVILVALNLPLVGLFVNLLRVPFRILFPIILLICLIGTYSISLSRFDLVILLGSGVMGYVFRKLRYDLAPFVLALIIGPTLEESFRQALMRSGGSFAIFWGSPMALGFIAVAAFLLFWSILRSLKPVKDREA